MEPRAADESEVQRLHDAPEEDLAPPHRRGVEQFAASVGNRNLSRVVAHMRDGEGIGPGGRVDPRVLEAIRDSRTFGRPLERAVARKVADHFGAPPPHVRRHDGGYAEAICRAVSARACTIGDGAGGVDIFYGAGERPGADRKLDFHELAHAYQQAGAPSTGDVTVSQPNDKWEREANAAAG